MHPLLGTAHSDTTPGTVLRGDLIVGATSGSVKWSRLPLGAANRCLVSNGVDAIWNTCLFTGFNAGAVPFVDSAGNLAQSPLSFAWDNVNRRLSVGSNAGSSTLTVHDGGAGASVTRLTVRGAQGQGANSLQVWQDPSGAETASIDSAGALKVRSLDVTSTSTRASWRETGTATDPSNRLEGDAWYNTTVKARKTVDGGQTHTGPQVLCSSTGATTSAASIALLGSCAIPGALLRAGDRLAIRATWAHGGSAGGFTIRWSWGNSVAGTHQLAASTTLASNRGDAAIHATGAVIENSFLVPSGTTGSYLGAHTDPMAAGLTLSLQGSVGVAGDSLSLIQFTVLRYPGQTNP